MKEKRDEVETEKAMAQLCFSFKLNNFTFAFFLNKNSEPPKSNARMLSFQMRNIESY